MENILDDLEKTSHEHEAIKPLMERLERALNGDKTISFRELQQELEQYIHSDNISLFEGLKEQLEEINEKLIKMTDPVGEYTTENMNNTNANNPVLEEVQTPVTDILSEIQPEPIVVPDVEANAMVENTPLDIDEKEPTLELSSMEDVMTSIYNHTKDKEEALNIVVGIPEDLPYTRSVLINGEAFHIGDTEEFDQKGILEMYRAISDQYNLEVLTNQTEDIELHNRFMASDGPHTIVLLNLPKETLENVYKEVSMLPEKPIEQIPNEKQVEPTKQIVKTNKPTNSSMGFANGLSLGMGIGIAIVLIIVAMMYFGVLKPW